MPTKTLRGEGGQRKEKEENTSVGETGVGKQAYGIHKLSEHRRGVASTNHINGVKNHDTTGERVAKGMGRG